MKISVIIFYSILFILFSCKEKSSQKEFYYKTGELKKKIVYQDAKDTTTFHDTSYYKNGNFWLIRKVKNAQHEGKTFNFSQNGNLKYIVTYNNNKLHGLTIDFNSKGEIFGKCLFIKGKQIIAIEFFDSKDNKLGQMRVSRVFIENDTTHEHEGHLIYKNSNNVIIDSNSFYYNIEAKDTINYGDTYRFSLTFHHDYDYSLKLLIGELDENLQFINPEKVKTYKSPNKKIKGQIEEYEPGWNLLLGKLYVYPDPQNKHPNAADEYEFIVFKEFYVKENK